MKNKSLSNKKREHKMKELKRMDILNTTVIKNQIHKFWMIISEDMFKRSLLHLPGYDNRNRRVEK